MQYEVHSILGQWWTSSALFHFMATPTRMGLWHFACSFLIILGTLIQMRGVPPIRGVRPAVVAASFLAAHGLSAVLSAAVLYGSGAVIYSASILWGIIALWLVGFMYVWRLQVRRELAAKGIRAEF